MSRAGTLESAPLLTYVASIGGLAALVNIEDDQRDYAEKVLERAAENGYLTLVAGDKFTIEVLGLHPALIWTDWFNIPAMAEDTHARLVAEDKLGRFIRDDEQLLALDGNTENIDPDNLSIVPKAGLPNHSKALRKLTPEQVREIRDYPVYHGGRREKGKGVVDMLAEKYGVSRHTIIDVRRRKVTGRSKRNYSDVGVTVRQEIAA